MVFFQMASYPIAYLLLKAYSRKFNFCFWFAFSAVILIILLIFKPGQGSEASNFWNKQNFHTLFLLPITALYQIIFLLATELFSTEIRGRAITMASVLARTTAIITPQVTIYCTSKNDFSFMYGLLLSLCCVQFVTVWFLPEGGGVAVRISLENEKNPL